MCANNLRIVWSFDFSQSIFRILSLVSRVSCLSSNRLKQSVTFRFYIFRHMKPCLRLTNAVFRKEKRMFVFPRLVQFFISPVYPHHHVVIHFLLEMVNLLYVINLLSDLCLIICSFAMFKMCRLALRQTSAFFFFSVLR